ncbi:MAG: T9SS type A sorting domain-containing protein [Bacteroidales bacterium]|nr:T9SS type A sorting domain-containing protein [Bacteroidales bacterium]
MNQEGEILDTITYSHKSKSKVFYNIHLTDVGTILLAGTENSPDNSDNNTLIFNSLNENLSNIDSAAIDLPDEERLINLHSFLGNNNQFLISGGYYHGPTAEERHSFVLIMNQSLDSIKFNSFEGDVVISHFRNLSNNNYWVLEEVITEISILDSLLSKVETINVPDFIFGNYSVKWDTDTSFYLLGYNLYPPPNYNLSLLRFFHPIDTAGYLTSLLKISDTTDYPSLRGGLDFRHKDSIFVGGTRNLDRNNIYHSSQPSWFMLFQTDSLLNVRWERFYGGDAYYVMQKLIATRDGGCLVAGTRYDYMNDPVPQTDIIVLKLNSEGLLVGNNELPETHMHEAIVYPNPGTDALQIRLAVQHPTALLELFDANGRLMLNQQLHQKESRIAVDHLPSGTYIYRLSADTGLLENGKWVKQ